MLSTVCDLKKKIKMRAIVERVKCIGYTSLSTTDIYCTSRARAASPATE